MQVRNSSLFDFRKTAFAVLATIFIAVAAYAQAPAKYANDTFTVISRTDRGPVHIHIRGEGDHCWATHSDDRTVAISMGDALCTSRPQDVPDNQVMVATVMPAKIAFQIGRAHV